MRIDFEMRTTEVTESARQPKRSKTDVSELVNELMHLGAALGRRVPTLEIGKRWKSHGGGTTDPEHHDDCEPEQS